MAKSSVREMKFPTTTWSLVLRGRDALGEIYLRYRQALKAFLVRTRGMRADDADDLLQQFFADKMIERDLLARVESQKGRFRTFLMQVLTRYHLNALRHDRADKRGHGKVAQNVEVHGQADRVRSDVFDVMWAREVLSTAVARAKECCEQSQRHDIWGVLEGRVLAPALRGEPAVAYEVLVARHGFNSVSAACNAMITGKRILERAVREIVSQYAVDEEDLELEIQGLFEVLRHAGA